MTVETLRKVFEKHVLPTAKYEEPRVAVLGVRKSGKTTAIGLLGITCTEMANTQKSKVKFLIDEKTSGVMEAPERLRSGRFPEETPEGCTFEADFYIKWGALTGETEVVLPIVETAGEEVEKLIKRFSSGMYTITPEDFKSASDLHQYILQSCGFIIITPVTSAPIFDGKSLEPQPKKLLEYPDVNMARLLTCIYRYKRKHPHSPQIKAIAVLLTKYDLLLPVLDQKGLDLNTREGVTKFMTLYFSQTYQILQWYGIQRVRFFPSFVSLERDEQTNDVLTHPDGKPKIKVINEKDGELCRIPEYSEKSYIELVGWIRENFAS